MKANNQDSLFLKCFIFDIEVNCLVDTGATVCILHINKYKLLPASMRPEINKRNTTLCLADGKEVDTFGYVDLPVQLGDMLVYHRFTIADVDVPGVIGYDFLNKFDCILEMGKGVVTIGSNKIKCIKESQMDSIFKIALVETVTIPPNTEIMTSGDVVGDSSCIMNAIVEPLNNENVQNI